MDSKLQELAATARNESLDVTQRRAALAHIARLLGADDYPVVQVPASDLKSVTAGVIHWPNWVPNRSLRTVAEAVREGRARRSAPTPHQ